MDHPSIKTKKINFIGKEIITGGIIIMPNAISIADTTRSIIKKGKNNKKPTKNALCNSLIINAGSITCMGVWLTSELGSNFAI